MALVVNTNVPALKSQRFVGLTQNSLTKSITRLSSGLRINTPADDAAGLSIAETLKNQITGFDRAYLNAQDGMSMLQVADGALIEISNMLNRMRELAIQSANGTYTANDRAYLQQEVDKLKEEINRVGAAAEFNTKKLLNGESIGIWSATSPNVDVIMNSKVAPGNYRFVTNTTAGQNAVYQSDVMQYANSSANVNITNGQELVKQIQLMDTPENNPLTGDKLHYSFEIDDNINNGNDRDKIITTASNTENSLNKVDNRLRDVDVNRSGYLLVEFNKSYPDEPVKDGTVVGDFVTLTWYDANGDGSESVYAPAEFDSAGRFLGLIPNDTLHDTFPPVTGLIFPSDDFNVDMTALSAFNEGTLDLDDFDDVQAGDRVLLSISDRNTVDDNAGPEEYTVKLNSFSNPDVTTDIQFNQLSGTRQTFQQVEMDENGNIWTYKYGVDFANNLGNINSDEGLVTFNIDEKNAKGNVAPDTLLRDIDKFTASDGQKVFATSQDLVVYGGNGQKAVVHLNGSDTVKDLEDKLTNAIIELGLGATDPTVNENLVNFVTPQNKGLYGDNIVADASLVIQTAVPGKEGQLYFVGDERLVRALSIQQIRDSEENSTSANVYDMYTNKLVSQEVTKDGVFRESIDGADVLYHSNVGLKPKWENGGIAYDPIKETIDIHIVDNSPFVHVGANAEQRVEFTIPQVDSTSLGLNGVSVVDSNAANNSIYLVDKAQTKLNNARGLIGAQMNRMEHTLNQTEVMNENMSAAESRIRDLDMAKEMTQFTKNQILAQTSTAMLAQANMMPQLVLQLLGA